MASGAWRVAGGDRCLLAYRNGKRHLLPIFSIAAHATWLVEAHAYDQKLGRSLARSTKILVDGGAARARLLVVGERRATIEKRPTLVRAVDDGGRRRRCEERRLDARALLLIGANAEQLELALFALNGRRRFDKRLGVEGGRRPLAIAQLFDGVRELLPLVCNVRAPLALADLLLANRADDVAVGVDRQLCKSSACLCVDDARVLAAAARARAPNRHSQHSPTRRAFNSQQTAAAATPATFFSFGGGGALIFFQKPHAAA